MSIKVYNGIKFKSKSFSEIIKQLNSIKKESLQYCGERINDTKDRNFRVLCYLVREWEKEHNCEIPGIYEVDRIIRKNLDKDYREYTDLGFVFNVVIFEHKGTFYGIYFDDTRHNYHLLFDKGIAEDYYYQNQTDKPDDVNTRSWNKREDVWENIFEEISPCWVASEAGATYDIVSSDNFSSWHCLMINNELLDKVKKFNEEFRKKKEKEENDLFC